MANKVPSKGTALLMEISAVYTAMPQLKSLGIAGEASETYDSTTLDGGTFKTHEPTGYSETATITAEVFRDPDDTVQAAFKALIATPVKTNFKVTYADTTPLSEIYVGSGFGFDTSAAPSDGLSASLSIKTTGAPS
jgi:hypothetical protein